ncbi:hypothetical protein [Rhodanobacter hydrolyticus]|uniref:Uncharacterized protein n=1 Tax=Rhodanobacter hydrolyticus TaxID=2250595 RepID=A0ABW8J3Q9_9GAMM
MQTIYYIQSFREGRPAQLLLRGHESEARWAAQLLTERYDGVLAWYQVQDYDEGYYGEPRVLVRSGEVPDIPEFET